MQKGNKLKRTIFYSLLILLCIASLSVDWMKKYFAEVSLEEIQFLLFSNKSNANLNILVQYAKETLTYLAIIIGIFIILVKINNIFKKQMTLKITKKNKERNITIFPFKINHRFLALLALLFAIYLFINFDKQFSFIDFVSNKLQTSTIYEEYFVDPLSVKIKFPEKKRNLIYIFLESMETTYTTYKHNNKRVSLIPNLEKLAKESTYFSKTSDFGGINQRYATGWTAAALVSQTAGVPLSIPIHGNDYGQYDSFLPGITNIGDILQKEGYKQMLMVGSDAKFGGRYNYFKGHGNYEIWDYYSAINEEKIPEDYFEFWGFEDRKLFEFAKEKLINLSKKEEPFNLTLLTVDTHFMEGYTDESCNLKYDKAYANAINCSDYKVNDFINWIKKQSFFKNTTIVLVGDHITMNSDFIKENFNYGERQLYNMFINSQVKPVNQYNREASSIDMLPTTLAAMGVTIEGNKLGLGTNLFSEEKTIEELLGEDYLETELSKNSKFYNNFLKNGN